MKAVIIEEYGSPEVLHLKEVDKPDPKENEVLIKVHAANVTKYDCWERSRSAPPGFGLLLRVTSGSTPKQPILGTELSGEIEYVGANVSRLQAGDQVFAFTGEHLGAYAEYTCLPESAAAPKPANLSYVEAAAVPQGALTALYFLRKSDIKPGSKVLIFGASGGVGGYAVQLAKHYFGAEVTGVCSIQKIAYVRSLGADNVIDYTREDFTQNGQRYDIIFDTVGKTPVFRTASSLTENGFYLLATFGLPMFVQLFWLSKTSGINVQFGLLEDKNEDLLFLKDLVEAGVIKVVIDRCYPLEQAAAAHRYVESWRKTGHVVLTVNHSQGG